MKYNIMMLSESERAADLSFSEHRFLHRFQAQAPSEGWEEQGSRVQTGGNRLGSTESGIKEGEQGGGKQGKEQ